MNLNVKFMISDIPTVLGALPVTLKLTFASLFFAILLAVLFGICILKKIPVLRQLVIGFNTFIKGVPLIVQLLFCYYALPYVLRAFVAFAFNYGAYMTDVVVSSYKAVDKGQLEAAYSVGMSTFQAMWKIVIPQAVVISLPNLSNYFMWLLKATSLASVVNVFELLATARASTAVNYAILEGYLVAAGIYWLVCIIAEQILKRINKKMNRYQKTVSAV